VTPVDAEEAAALAAIHAEAFDHPWDADALSDLLTSSGVFALADANRRGFVLIRTVVDEAEVLTIAVKRDARRHGLARHLMDQAARTAADRGAVSLFLEVAVDNDAAIALYADLGFQTTGRRTGYYARPGAAAVDALVLKKPLLPTA